MRLENTPPDMDADRLGLGWSDFRHVSQATVGKVGGVTPDGAWVAKVTLLARDHSGARHFFAFTPDVARWLAEKLVEHAELAEGFSDPN